MLRDSKDVKVREARVNIRSCRKWSAKETVKEAESRLRHGDIVGSVAVGILGLGVTSTARWGTASEEERRQLVQREVRTMEENTRMWA